jgi:hypothetical protein
MHPPQDRLTISPRLGCSYLSVARVESDDRSDKYVEDVGVLKEIFQTCNSNACWVGNDYIQGYGGDTSRLCDVIVGLHLPLESTCQFSTRRVCAERQSL